MRVCGVLLLGKTLILSLLVSESESVLRNWLDFNTKCEGICIYYPFDLNAYNDFIDANPSDIQYSSTIGSGKMGDRLSRCLYFPFGPKGKRSSSSSEDSNTTLDDDTGSFGCETIVSMQEYIPKCDGSDKQELTKRLCSHTQNEEIFKQHKVYPKLYFIQIGRKFDILNREGCNVFERRNPPFTEDTYNDKRCNYWDENIAFTFSHTNEIQSHEKVRKEEKNPYYICFNDGIEALPADSGHHGNPRNLSNNDPNLVKRITLSSPYVNAAPGIFWSRVTKPEGERTMICSFIISDSEFQYRESRWHAEIIDFIPKPGENKDPNKEDEEDDDDDDIDPSYVPVYGELILNDSLAAEYYANIVNNRWNKKSKEGKKKRINGTKYSRIDHEISPGEETPKKIFLNGPLPAGRDHSKVKTGYQGVWYVKVSEAFITRAGIKNEPINSNQIVYATIDVGKTKVSAANISFDEISKRTRKEKRLFARPKHDIYDELDNADTISRMDEVYADCRDEKMLCYNFPSEEGCLSRERCSVLLAIKDEGQFNRLNVTMIIQPEETRSDRMRQLSPYGWAAFAFSPDAKMGREAVFTCAFKGNHGECDLPVPIDCEQTSAGEKLIECVTKKLTNCTQLYMTFNLRGKNNIYVRPEVRGSGTANIQDSIQNGVVRYAKLPNEKIPRVICSFQINTNNYREITLTSNATGVTEELDKVHYDLKNKEYYILLATGSSIVEDWQISYHGKTKRATGKSLLFSRDIYDAKVKSLGGSIYAFKKAQNFYKYFYLLYFLPIYFLLC